MVRDKAVKTAEHAAKTRGESYVCIQARNGQWMVERYDFVVNDARGRMIYGGRRMQIVSPDGKWTNHG